MTLENWLALAAILVPLVVAGMVTVGRIHLKTEAHALKIASLERNDGEHKTSIDGLLTKFSDLREYLAGQFGEIKGRLPKSD